MTSKADLNCDSLLLIYETKVKYNWKLSNLEEALKVINKHRMKRIERITV